MPLSREEFTATMARLYATTDEGFKALVLRLDQLNGRTFTGEVARAALNERVTSLEKETFHHRRGDGNSNARADAAALAIGLTRRESALLTLGFTLIALLLKVIDFLGTKAWHGIVGH